MNYTISQDDVFSFLANNQICKPFTANQEVRNILQDSNVCEDLDNSEAEDDPMYVELKPLWISLSVFTMCVILWFQYAVTTKQNKHDIINCQCLNIDTPSCSSYKATIHLVLVESILLVVHIAVHVVIVLKMLIIENANLFVVYFNHITILLILLS